MLTLGINIHADMNIPMLALNFHADYQKLVVIEPDEEANEDQEQPLGADHATPEDSEDIADELPVWLRRDARHR